MSPVRRIIITLATAFCFGLGLSYLWYDTEEVVTQEALSQERVTKPKDGVKTCAFTMRLLQAAMQVQTEGNIVVAPDSLAALLNRLKGLSDGPAKTALEALKLPEEPAQTAVLPSEVALIFPDSALKLQQDIVTGRDIYPVPISKNLSEAYIAIDKALGFYTEQELNGTAMSALISPTRSHGASRPEGVAINTDIRLIALNGISFHEPWMLQPDTTGGSTSDFTNADGTSSQVGMVKHKGLYRVAEAADGSWKAVAVFFDNSGKEGDSACLVAILPKDGDARKFAKGMTAEKLSEIRTALMDVPKTYCTVEIPAIATPPTSQDISPLLSELGLGALFTQEKPFPKLTPAAVPLSMVIQQYRLSLKEKQVDEEEETAPAAPLPGKAETAFKADRPFLWYIGDLGSDQPPYLMGIIEKL